MKKIIYQGDSKILIRICDAINDLIDGGGGGGGSASPLYYDSEGHICIDYDLLEERNNGE